MALKTPRERLLEAALAICKSAALAGRPGGLVTPALLGELAIEGKVLEHAIDTFDNGLEVVDVVRKLEDFLPAARRLEQRDVYYDTHHEGEFLCPCPECGPDDRPGGNT